MSDIAIELSSVSKRYRLRGGGWYVTSIKDEVGRLSARLLGREVPPREEFWALRDVSFSLKRGDTLGLIGRNGAGKSTLLKVLSRVTVPTTGSFVTNGRLGSLIEIGAGFHPDLTGRENIFLNGSIMGMTRREVQRKFDQIVAFSEVERFIDTPIKHYSSGMQMRLGFAVAAHTDVAAPSGTDFHFISCPGGIEATRVDRLSSVRWRPSSVLIDPGCTAKARTPRSAKR